jgi:hypothetical protein
MVCHLFCYTCTTIPRDNAARCDDTMHPCNANGNIGEKFSKNINGLGKPNAADILNT